LPDVAVVPSEHFNTVLYTGNATARSITGVGFQPDLVWTKGRSAAWQNRLTDAVRGTGKELESDSTSAETTSNDLTSFNSDGFSLGTSNNGNSNGNTFVAWNWKANGSGSSNTDGTINTTATSANVDAGFSISTYTGNGVDGATVGHGLSKAPEMMIVKKRSATPDAENWVVYHTSLGATKGTYLNLTATPYTLDIYWNNTEPTSSVFSIGDWDGINTSSQPYIAYCFHSVDGYSKVGSYTGNGSTDGTFVYTGFRPAFILHKKTNGSANWIMTDAIRNTSNPVGKYLMPNSSNAEADGTSFFDYTSNGFKLRTSGGGQNGSGDTHIFIAFAETPFKYSNAR
jgi:hypothetical protein